MPSWPTPVRQALGSFDCTFAAASYVCRVLGHEVSLDTIREWCTRTSRSAEWYPEAELGFTAWNQMRFDGEDRKHWWLGPAARDWVRVWLARGCVGVAVVYAGGSLLHAVVLLEADDDGVLVMDPAQGFVRHPWAWFLGSGAGSSWQTVHRIDGWYGPLTGPRSD